MRVSRTILRKGDDSSHVRASDILRGGIRYNAGRVQLETAIDYLKVGPALYYPLTLSGYTPPTYLKGTLDFHLVQYRICRRDAAVSERQA